VSVDLSSGPLAGEAVSNTKAYQSPLDVPPSPRNVTTRIKAKLRITHHNPSSRTHPKHPPPKKAEGSQGASASLLPRAGVRTKKIGSSLIRSSCIRDVYIHHLLLPLPPPAAQYCPRFRSPCIQSSRIGRVAMYTTIICQRTSMLYVTKRVRLDMSYLLHS
jgi:hypothetical protein